jgi:hypothetical protein
MFKNSDIDSDAEAGHKHSGRSFIKVPLVDQFNHSYEPLAQDEDFYSGEEAGKSDKEYLEFARADDVNIEEIHQGEPKTSGIVPTDEVSITNPHVLAAVSNQSNQRN